MGYVAVGVSGIIKPTKDVDVRYMDSLIRSPTVGGSFTTNSPQAESKWSTFEIIVVRNKGYKLIPVFAKTAWEADRGVSQVIKVQRSCGAKYRLERTLFPDSE